MARITVEDCVDKVDTRFNLILIAAHRARQLSTGTQPNIPRNNDKNTVVALREIASDAVDINELREEKIKTLQETKPENPSSE